MKNITLNQVMREVNKQITGHTILDLQFLRKEILGLSKIPSRKPFPAPKVGKDYLFHVGGRRELQFNIGVSKATRTVRFGVAYSIFRDITLRDIDDLRPSIQRFNKYIAKYPGVFKGKIMSHSGSGDYRPRSISEDLIFNNNFVFLGIRQSFDNIDYTEALECLDSLLPLYIYTIRDTPTKAKKKTAQQVKIPPNSMRVISEDEESAFPEGREIYRHHRLLERDATISRQAKAKKKAETGTLCCDGCGFDFRRTYGNVGDGYIEAHHTIPVSKLGGRTKTKLSDLALVCANCHRMLHRGPELLSVDQLKKGIKNQARKR